MNGFPSPRHNRALTLPTGYRRWFRFTATRGGRTVELEPVAGQITQDGRRRSRWDGTLTVTGDRWLPRTPRDILTPFGTVVSAELGIELADGSRSFVPFGRFVVAASSGRVSGGVTTVDVGLADLSTVIEKYRFEEPFAIPASTDIAQVVNLVVADRTGVSPLLSDEGRTTATEHVLGLEAESPPWGELLDVLNGFGLTAWYDRSGSVVIGADQPTAEEAVQLTGPAELEVDFDDQPPNVMVVRGEPMDDSTPPVHAVAMDTDPTSPTYAGATPGGSNYGRVTRYYASQLITTEAQALETAEVMLARHLGEGATYTITRPYDPTRDPGDVLSFEGFTFAVDAVTVDLTGQTTMTVRELSA